MNFPKPSPNLNSWKRRFLLVLIPVLILVADYKFFPVVFETYSEDKTADITYLLTHQSQSLGRFKGHQISVSLDDIRGSQFLNYLKEKSNALVVSVFRDEEGAFEKGPLLRAAMQQLQKLSPNDHRKITDRLGKKGSIRAGEVMAFPLTLPVDKHKEFPVDVLMILVFESGNVGEDELGLGIKSVLDLAQQQKVTNLVLPCLGVNWEFQPKISFSDFFKVVFDKLSASDRPLHLYLSLYRQWPSYLLEDALAGLNGSWEADLQKPAAAPSLYRSDLRLTLVFLTLCIFVCSFFARLTVVNVLVIGLSFVGISLGTHQLIDLFAQGYPPKFRFFVQIAILVALAFGFPFIVTWDVKSIFKQGD
jgi:hypothetical protein